MLPIKLFDGKFMTLFPYTFTKKFLWAVCSYTRVRYTQRSVQQICGINRKRNFCFSLGHILSMLLSVKFPTEDPTKGSVPTSTKESWLLAGKTPHQWSTVRPPMVRWRFTKPTEQRWLYMRWAIPGSKDMDSSSSKGHDWALHVVTSENQRETGESAVWSKHLAAQENQNLCG